MQDKSYLQDCMFCIERPKLVFCLSELGIVCSMCCNKLSVLLLQCLVLIGHGIQTLHSLSMLLLGASQLRAQGRAVVVSSIEALRSICLLGSAGLTLLECQLILPLEF